MTSYMAEPRVTGEKSRVYVGEFDPGSGRTLAARLMHASRATHIGGVIHRYDGAANG